MGILSNYFVGYHNYQDSFPAKEEGIFLPCNCEPGYKNTFNSASCVADALLRLEITRSLNEIVGSYTSI